jgi:hypothetical protein
MLRPINVHGVVVESQWMRTGPISRRGNAAAAIGERSRNLAFPELLVSRRWKYECS